MALEPLSAETRHLIDGRLVESASGGRFANVNPATEEVLGTAADATGTELHAAIAAARRAFDTTRWATDSALRARCLRQLHAGLIAEKEQLRSIVVREAGAPLALTSFMHVDDPIDMLLYWAEKAESTVYERPMSDVSFLGRAQRRLLRREAMGVVGAITPWNVPLLLNLTKIGAALAAGCTVVLKPAPDTPWSATHLGRIVTAATELPPGVLNIVASSDPLVGEALARDPRVDMVTFTGSTATGRRVMEVGSATVKKVFLELGGKSAAIVLDDADLATVLQGAAATCIHAGQGCAISTRWLLPRSRYAEALEILRVAFAAWRYGDPEDPANLQGPQISRRQQERVLGWIDRGRAEGARLLAGGGRPPRRGFYVEPTLFVDVDPKSSIAQEEVFGPVCCVIPYDDDEHAVAIANDSIYGLSGAVYSPDERRALDIARRIRTGTVSVNGGQWFHVDTPFGGYRQSGVGRENGEQGFDEHFQTKVIAMPGGTGSG